MAHFTRSIAARPLLLALTVAVVAAVGGYAASNLLLLVLGPFFGFGLGVALSSYLRERDLPYTPTVG